MIVVVIIVLATGYRQKRNRQIQYGLNTVVDLPYRATYISLKIIDKELHRLFLIIKQQTQCFHREKPI